MGYAILDLELGPPPMRLDPSSADAAAIVATLPPDQDGIAIIARYEREPVGFAMLGMSELPTRRLSAGAAWRALGADVARRVAARRERDDLLRVLPANGAAPPTVTVAICTKDRTALVGRCLRSILRSIEACESDGTGVSVLVVDNAPSDQATENLVTGEFPRDLVSHVVERLPGLDFARNRALDHATSDVVAFVDDDVEVDHEWLRILRRTWASHPNAGAVTGQVLPLVLDTPARIAFERDGGFRRGFDREVYSMDRLDASRIYPCVTGVFGVGCNLSVHRDHAIALGGFDPALDTGRPLPGGGDHDMLYRIVRSSRPLVYEPGAAVFHEHRETNEQLRRQYWTWGETVTAFAQKQTRGDPAMRSRWQRQRLARLAHLARRATTSLLGIESRSAIGCGAELAGAVFGLFGSYRRSVRRTEQLRRETPP